MTTEIYDDGLVRLDHDGVTLRRYYFPTGPSKRIPYDRIRSVDLRRMGWLTGKGRGWGTAHPRYWLPLDLRRPVKDRLVVLDVGRWVYPAFSPRDPDQVVALLRERIEEDRNPRTGAEPRFGASHRAETEERRQRSSPSPTTLAAADAEQRRLRDPGWRARIPRDDTRRRGGAGRGAA